MSSYQMLFCVVCKWKEKKKTNQKLSSFCPCKVLIDVWKIFFVWFNENIT